MKRILAFLGILLWTFSLSGAESSKKMIELGWDIPSTKYLAENYEEMERTTPFDGVMFRIDLVDEEGNGHTSDAIWDATPWKAEWLDVPLAELKSCKFSKFTDNFLRFNATPGTIAWDDEAGWGTFFEKVTMVARFLKAAGCKGVAPDFESYGKFMFRYDPESNLSFEEICKLARKRGADFITAIAREFPDAVVLALWLNSENFRAAKKQTPEEVVAVLKSRRYSYLPSFIDGMLDTLPPEMTLVDGCEEGYYYNSRVEYFESANDMISWSGLGMRLVSPENRAKYRLQVQAGFGFYLDMFSNPEGHKYYRGPREGGTRLDRLHENLAAAYAACDKYVWIYGERFRWWNGGPHWEEGIPGVTEVIEKVKKSGGEDEFSDIKRRY